MIKKLKNAFIVAAAAAALLTPVAVPVMASAASPASPASLNIGNNLCGGTDVNLNGGTDCNATTTGNKLSDLIKTVINLFSFIVGVVSVIMIIVGGLKYITSGGESSNISSAKNTIVFAIVGLVIVALAQFIVHFVLGKVSATV